MMEPRFILAGQAPNVLGALMEGTAAAKAANDFDRQIALEMLYAQQGPQIAAGNRNALDALARFEPQSSLAVQNTRQVMAMRAQDMQMRREAARRQAEEDARRAGAEEAAATREELKRFLQATATFYRNGDREGFARFVAQHGPPLGATPETLLYDDFPAKAIMMVGAIDGLTPAKTDPSRRYRVVGNQLVDLEAPTGPKVVLDAPGQREVVYGPDGRPIFERGTAADAAVPRQVERPETTMPQGVDFTNATGLSGALTGMLNSVTDALGLGVVSPENEQAAVAMRNLARRTMIELSKDVPGRPSNYLLQQFNALTVEPNSVWQGEGRTREKLNQTMQLIEAAIRDNYSVATSTGIYSARDVDEARRNLVGLVRLRDDYAAVIESFGRRESTPPARQGAGARDRPPPPGVDPEDWKYLTPEEKALWE